MNTGSYILLKNIAPYTLYVLSFILFFVSLTGRIKWSLFLLVFLFPLQNVYEKLLELPLGKDINDILIIGMIIGWFVNKLSKRRPLLENTVFNKILLLYITFSLFSFLHGFSFLGMPINLDFLDPRFQNWKNYMILPLLFLITFNNLTEKKQLKQLFFVICLTMLVMNFYNVRTITWMGSWASRDRMWGTFVWLSINSTAAFYATYTFVLLGIWFFIKNRKSKLFLLILIIMNFYCVLFLFSRGAYAAALLGFLILGLLYKKWFLIPVVLTVLLWQTVLPKQVIERIQVTVQEDGSLDTSAERRVSLWQEGMNYFLENPIFGMGYNTFSYRAKGADTHNLFVRTLAEEGVIGFLFLLAIFFTAFLKATLLYKRTNDKFLKGLGLGFAVCSMAMLAANFFGDRWSFLQVGSYFWLFLAMVERGNAMTALELISRKKRKR